MSAILLGALAQRQGSYLLEREMDLDKYVFFNENFILLIREDKSIG